ncbi:MAG TPA: dephospho-CoA kinase [Fimbriimonadales bacterium]|jgi:dephospho-CoA kinase|nr:dephospho-CoA kinase [Fimbriimonadales bacterium]
MRVAVTGGIADGKSTILTEVAALGFPTISADDVVKQLYETDAIRSTLIETFGTTDKREIRRRILEDPSDRRRLNSIFHLPVMRRIFDFCDSADRPAFAEIPLLIETATQEEFDEVWVATAGRDEQLRRLTVSLGGDSGLAQRLLETQLPTTVKEAFGDYVIWTNRPRKEVREFVRALAARLFTE